MDVKKQLSSLGRMTLPAVGFVLISVGAYLVSLQTGREFASWAIPVYFMIAIGFLAMLIGVYWSICHSMKSKMHRRGGRQQRIQVFTIERPSSFPPSYEDSQRDQICPDTPSPELVVVVDGVDMVMSLAPPLYSQDITEDPDCTWSWERPPRYSQVERTQQGRLDAEVVSGH